MCYANLGAVATAKCVSEDAELSILGVGSAGQPGGADGGSAGLQWQGGCPVQPRVS